MILALTLLAGAATGVALEGTASASASITRLAGANRVATAVSVSQSSFPATGSAGAVVVASDASFADALSGTPLAVAKHSPLLLTPPDALDPVLAAEVQRVLAPGGTVFLVGGTAAISANVAAQITALGFTVARLAGGDRFATAVTVAQALPSVATVLEATGLNFPDALAAGAAAAAGGGAVLLTNGATMPGSTATYLAQSSVARFAVGGAAAAADASATPLVGADRYATAVRVAQRFFPGPTAVGIASGANFPDALPGGAHIAALGGPLLLTDPNVLSPATENYLTTNMTAIGTAFVYGGAAAVSAGRQGRLPARSTASR
ncbi:MAG TPA: cell wall-binding repeat-containing protein [Acidimicrobiales bacterium]|nr:cell wall-binding repeat-containing protein [Acidimicrobiales bacterium]